LLDVDIWNIPVNGFALYLLDKDLNVLQEVQAEGESNIGFEYQISPGTYYLELGSVSKLLFLDFSGRKSSNFKFTKSYGQV